MTDVPGDEQPRPLLTLADIAELADVGRSAVSNWRNRLPNFPKPVAGSTANPLYDPGDVTVFLQGRGRSVAPPSLDRRLSRTFDLLRNAAPVTALVEGLCAAAAVRYVLAVPRHADNLAGSVEPRPNAWTEAWSTSFESRLTALTRAARDLEADAPALQDLLAPALSELPPAAGQLLALLDEVDVEKTAELVEAAVGVLRRVTGRGGGELTTAAPLVGSMLSLAHPIAGTVYDPAAGLGGALIEAARVSSQVLHLRGQEVNVAAWRLANLRLIVADLHGSVDLGDTLLSDADRTLRASVIVADPPLGLSYWGAEQVALDERWRFGEPPAKSADMAWLQHAVAHLAPGGRAFVLLPTSSLFRGGPDGRVRHELVRQGAVEAVISLPAGLVPRTSIELALWVLTRPGEAADPHRVLLVDGAAGGPHGFLSRLSELVQMYHRWRAHAETPEVDWATTATRLDLLGIDATLDPARWLPSALENAGADPLIGQMNEDAEALSTILRGLGRRAPVRIEGVTGRVEGLRRMTVDRMAGEGQLRVFRGARVPRESMYGDAPAEDDDAGGVPVLAARQVRSGVLPAPSACPRVPVDVLDQKLERTEAGDVVVLPEGDGIRALVVQDGGAIAAAPLWVLRPVTGRLDPWYLAACLASEWNDRHLRGSAILRANVRDLEVPVPPLAQQRALADQVRRLHDLQRDTDRAAQLIRSMTERLADGFAAGVLTVENEEDDGDEI